MKKSYFCFLASIASVTLLTSCEKSKAKIADDEGNGCIKVHYVKSICNVTVLQIEDPTYYLLGEDNWLDQHSGIVRNHVFTTDSINVYKEIQRIRNESPLLDSFFYVMKEPVNTDLGYNSCGNTQFGTPPLTKIKVKLSKCRPN
jgi:hypothetical protein